MPDTSDSRPTPQTPQSGQVSASDGVITGLAKLPSFTRSLLKVRVPVRVTLASARQSLQRILDLSPGSILQFNKGCEDPLSLEIGEQTVALGQAVKVGDKFGLWITEMAMPEERFWVVGKASGRRAR